MQGTLVTSFLDPLMRITTRDLEGYLLCLDVYQGSCGKFSAGVDVLIEKCDLKAVALACIYLCKALCHFVP